jgi:membrane-associated protein
MLPNILEWFQSLPEYALLPAVGAMAFGEAIVGLGVILPGEAAVLFYSATVGSMPEFMLLWSVTVSCIVAGSVVGFEIGRRSGSSLRDSRVVRRHGADRWERATGLLRKHGIWAVFLGRLTPFVRSVVPAVAGAAGMP